jgi:hypothetical protein
MQIFRFIFRFELVFVAFVWLKVGRLCAAGGKISKVFLFLTATRKDLCGNGFALTSKIQNKL